MKVLTTVPTCLPSTSPSPSPSGAARSAPCRALVPLSPVASARAATPPKVSVVMPCFNAAATIADSIGSVTDQSFADLELIVVDDGSSDGSAEIVGRLARDEPRLRLLRQSNCGPSAARNRGIKAARGELIAFLDADDLWMRDHLVRIVVRMLTEPGIGVAFSGAVYIDRAGRPTGGKTRLAAAAITPADMLHSNPAGTLSTIVARRAVLDEVGLLREDMRHAEDQEWLFRAASAGVRVQGTGTYTTVYRIADGGLSSDTARMRAGWNAFVRHARERAPEIVDACEASATAQMNLYWAKHAWRTRHGVRPAATHLMSAVAASPSAVASAVLRQFSTMTSTGERER